MIRKSLIALATVATLATGTAATSQAKTFIDIDIYGGGFYGGYGGWGYGYYPGGCGFKWVAYKKWNWNHTFYKIKHKKVYVCY